jgi:uroporphyrinogen decarboxylase
VEEPEFVEEMLDIQTKLILGYLEIVSDLPYDGILLSDDWCDQRGVLFGRPRWQKYIKPLMAEIIKRTHETGKFFALHCCGSFIDIMPDIVEIGMDVIESVQPEAKDNDPYVLKRLYGDKITFWGGLGSQSIIPNGTVLELKQEIKKLVTEMGKGGAYILSPAKPLMCGTPPENAVAIFEAFVDQNY